MRSLRAETVLPRDRLTSFPERFRRQVSPDTLYVDLPGPLMLESGFVLPKVTVAYRTWGHIENAKGRAILVCHALTGSADADTWWPGIIGPGCAFDPARDFVICSNILGSCYGTSGPVSAHPERGGAYRSDFPQISIRDMVTVQAALLDYLGIDELHLVTGPSLGGMQVLEWAAMYPERVRSIIPVGVSGRHSAWCIGISEAQRAAIEADPNWNNGAYTDAAPPDKGLSAARMMAMCSYRSWDNMEQRFSRERRTDGLFQVQAYLRYQGQKINARFDANAYIRLTQAMDSHDIARGRGSYPEILRGIRQPALVISVRSDILYPPAEQELLARLLQNSELQVLDSDHGHDGFLIRTRELGDLIAAFRLALEARQNNTTLRGMPTTIAAS
jgi:homoserine O-acetyltransferase/O-succinyltransferase